MGKMAGRLVEIYWDGERVLGAREKNFTLGGETINTTTDDDEGIRTVLEDESGELITAEDTFDLTVSGMIKRSNTDLLEAMANREGRNREMLIDMGGLGTFEGKFAITNFELGAPYQDAVTYSATIQNNGPWVYTKI